MRQTEMFANIRKLLKMFNNFSLVLLVLYHVSLNMQYLVLGFILLIIVLNLYASVKSYILRSSNGVRSTTSPWSEATSLSLCLQKYTSELAGHQNRVILFRYNLDLRSVFGVVNTPVYNHAKPNKVVFSPLTERRKFRHKIIHYCYSSVDRPLF